MIEPFRLGLAERWRGSDARVMVRRTARRGVAVIVLNSTEKSHGSEAIIAGAEDAERHGGTDSEPIRIAGQEGRIARARDGAFIAFGIAGECSTLVLIADTERLLRDAAAFLRPA